MMIFKKVNVDDWGWSMKCSGEIILKVTPKARRRNSAVSMDISLNKANQMK